MSALTKISIDADKMAIFTAQLDNFGDVLAEKSDKLIEYVETASVITKRLHLETESLRSVTDSIKMAVVEALKEEFKASANPVSNQLFVNFSSKATTFFDHQFSVVNRANDNLKKTIDTCSNLSLKSLVLLAITSVLIGVATFFGCYYLMPSQRLTQDEMDYMYYGQAYITNSKIVHTEIKKLISEEAHRLRKTAR